MKLTLVLLTSLYFSLGFGESAMKAGARLGEWTQDLKAAQALAKEKNLPLFLNFTGSDWCGWCIHMDKKVFNTTEWKEYARNNLILVTLDFPRNKSIVPEEFIPRNKSLANQFQVKGFPTYYVVSADLKNVKGRLGAIRDASPEVFIGQVKSAL